MLQLAQRVYIFSYLFILLQLKFAPLGPLKSFVDDGDTLRNYANSYLVDFQDFRLLRIEATRVGVKLPDIIVVSFDQSYAKECEWLFPEYKSYPPVVANKILDCLEDDNRFEV